MINANMIVNKQDSQNASELDNLMQPSQNNVVTFTEDEWKIFTQELESGKDIKKALHNARYFAELKQSVKELDEGKGTKINLSELENLIKMAILISFLAKVIMINLVLNLGWVASGGLFDLFHLHPPVSVPCEVINICMM